MTLQPNQLIGNYRILRPLGEGGMGAVYEVEHVKLGVHYALKTFTFEGGHDEILRNKFLAEGKVLARLGDPHLVRVFDLDFDVPTGTLYFVMDLVLYTDGQPRTLADVETADLDEDYVLRWFGELASALDYIHAQGIVHRDIKLGNILLNADRGVVLSDFGISRFFSQDLKNEIDAVTTMVSEVGTSGHLVMGTQGYMAPEVARGEEATPAADAYSLGVMFVYLLTGLWYTPGSKVFRLLETLEYRWIDVLPKLLAENPAERPTCLTELVRQVAAPVGAFRRNAQDASPSSVGAFRRNAPQGDSRKPLLMRISAKCAHVGRGTFALAAALLAIAAVGYFVFAYRAASTTPTASTTPIASTASTAPAAPTTSTPSSVPDVFDAAFGTSGIYESPTK